MHPTLALSCYLSPHRATECFLSGLLPHCHQRREAACMRAQMCSAFEGELLDTSFHETLFHDTFFCLFYDGDIHGGNSWHAPHGHRANPRRDLKGDWQLVGISWLCHVLSSLSPLLMRRCVKHFVLLVKWKWWNLKCFVCFLLWINTFPKYIQEMWEIWMYLGCWYWAVLSQAYLNLMKLLLFVTLLSVEKLDELNRIVQHICSEGAANIEQTNLWQIDLCYNYMIILVFCCLLCFTDWEFICCGGWRAPMCNSWQSAENSITSDL